MTFLLDQCERRKSIQLFWKFILCARIFISKQKMDYFKSLWLMVLTTILPTYFSHISTLSERSYACGNLTLVFRIVYIYKWYPSVNMENYSHGCLRSITYPGVKKLNYISKFYPTLILPMVTSQLFSWDFGRSTQTESCKKPSFFENLRLW